MNDDLLNDFFLEAFPNPERKGCPDEETLRAFAEDRLPPGDPTLRHVSSCSECYAEYKHYREDWKEAAAAKAAASVQSERLVPQVPEKPVATVKLSRQGVIPWALVAIALLILGGGLFLTRTHQSRAPEGPRLAANATPRTVNVDLFNAVTVRGGSGDDPTPLEEVSLPSSVVNLSVTLPRFSESGSYRIVVARDKAGAETVARGLGNAVDANGKVSVLVTLDLTKVAPGMYFLATVRGSDNGTYYYPLKVQ